MAIFSDASGNKYSVTVDSTQNPPALSIVAASSSLSVTPDGSYLPDASGGTWKVSVASDGSLSLSLVPGGVVPTGYISIVAQDLIASAMRLIGVLASGELPKINEANDGLMVLNQLIDSWNAEHLNIFTTSIYEFALQAGKQTYTLGDGGDFNMQRPASIDGMSVILLDNPNNPIEVPLAMLTTEQWQRDYPVKNVSSSWPQAVYDDGNFPLRSLNFWGVPNSSANHVRIYAWQQLPTYSLTSSIALPPRLLSGAALQPSC